MSLLRFDPSGLFNGPRGRSPADFMAFAKATEAIRDELVNESWRCTPKTVTSPPAMSFAGTVIALPEVMLAHYERFRSASILGRMFRSANRMFGQVDTVVVIGSNASTSSAQAIKQACAHPCLNELSRAHRGGKPRLYFEGDMLDNDATTGLLERLDDLTGDYPAMRRWGLCAFQSSDPASDAMAALSVFEKHWLKSERSQTYRVNPRPVILMHETGTAVKPAPGGYVPIETFEIPRELNNRFGAFTVAGVLPIALIGVDCMQLILGGINMTENFRSADFENNLVLQFAAANLMALHSSNPDQNDTGCLILGLWSKVLESLGAWYTGLHTNSRSQSRHSSSSHMYLLPRERDRLELHYGKTSSLLHSVHVANYRSDALTISGTQVSSIQPHLLFRIN